MALSGITYSHMLEWRFAAQWAGYCYTDFEKLDGDEQSRVVATYRSHLQIEATLAREQGREAQRSARRSRSRGGRKNPNT